MMHQDGTDKSEIQQPGVDILTGIPITAQALCQQLLPGSPANTAPGTPVYGLTSGIPSTVPRTVKQELPSRHSGGGTVHHHGPTPPRTGSLPSHTNLYHKMSNQQKSSTGHSSSAFAAANKLLMETKSHSGLSSTFPNLTALANQSSSGPSPKKKIKVEEKPPPTSEIANYRKLVHDNKIKEMLEIKENYIENLSELFFLQNGGNMMDYFVWTKRPTPQLVNFLKSSNIDSDDEEDHGLERKINNEVKVLTCSGSNVPIATPVAISTTLPPSVAALNQQGFEVKRQGGRHGMVFGHALPITPHSSPPVSTESIVTSSIPPQLSYLTTQSPIAVPLSVIQPEMTQSAMLSPALTVSSSVTTTVTPAVTMPQLQSQLTKTVTETKPLSINTSIITKSASSPALSTMVKSHKSPPVSPLTTPRPSQISSVYDGSVGTQEAIVERAKQEAQVMHRVAELRKDGLWSSRRLPKVHEPPRCKGHWDYLLEEMQWLAADFQQERKWKKVAARKLAKMVTKHFQDMEQKEQKAEEEEGKKLKKIASQIAKCVKEFWSNIEKVVQYKQQSRLEEKRKKALDIHLNFIVDQTEKYSTWLTEGLKQGSSVGSTAGSLGSLSEAGDDEFKPEVEESDDEETIEKEEEEMEKDESSTKEELEALQKESEVPLEDLLKTLPSDILEKPASLPDDDEIDEPEDDGKDEEFTGKEEDEADKEETIAEQEKHEKKTDYSNELKDLEDEGDLPMEELYKKYAAAYDSDFEYDEPSDEEGDETEEEEGESEEEEEEEEEEDVDVEEDVGLESLMEQDKETVKEEFDATGPGKELTDIAAEAASLQPKGYTLDSTSVKTTIPFLLKHTMREYQHVGLDWLATMYEKRLNGILADEMGLGKTIQTIALLAHLACEKVIWGPHLIVVPTSVMLNWELELKKWCPAFKILTYYGTQKERKLKRQGWTKTNAFHVCITSYKLVIQDHQAFRRKKWKYLILDEAQNIKNFKSQRWQMLLNFSSQRRLLLTGTPLQNSLMELWSLMHFLMPHVFQSHKEFKEWFANPLTGMIEGSHEYNESLIRRLHKVLRPFLLRRLKCDVEKQMPKKYEHVVMCHLSKRQRYLYEDFMSQGATRETLQSGHFMSVINVLMQLRKVCNHPSLFDPRPIISPFQAEGICYRTSSCVLNVLEYDPLRDIDLYSLYPSLADMEINLPAFVAHRVRGLQTSRKLIEEIDDTEEYEQRPVPGKLQPTSFPSVFQQCGRSSPAITSTVMSNGGYPASSVPVMTPTVTTVSTPGMVTVASSMPVTSVVQTNKLQTKVGPQSAGQTPVSTQPITVQIQQTDQGARLMIPAGQLSQLPAGFIQIVQTSLGQQMIATSAVSSVATTASAVVNGHQTITTTASSSVTATTMATTVRSSVQLPLSTMANQKPVMRVSPLTSESQVSSSIINVTDLSGSVKLPGAPLQNKSVKKKVRKEIKKSEFYCNSLEEKKMREREQKLDFIANTNEKHCSRVPVYGQDLCHTVDVFRDMNKTCVKDNTWKGLGMVYCRNVHTWPNVNHPSYYWKQTKVLSNLVNTPEQFLHKMEDILLRYTFITPPVTAPRIQMHVSHPPPQHLVEERRRETLLQSELSPKATCLHPISTRLLVQFPEKRLIQYDCGKLQVLDILLHRLKTEGHRVLIFTQMTKMLNILEAFLNYHGHIYLRLDGTTKVEQRQFLMDRFNADRRIFVFILSTRSGGIGVNLTGADTVIFYDSDWNPTMDAQAQDRCHRIGQTRDVHIYRLVSERTVEENILKKANQKRMLGDMAIEGGNFTTTFFKEQTIKDLFSEPSGLDSLVKEKEDKKEEKTAPPEAVDLKMKSMKEVAGGDDKPVSSDTTVLNQFEKALAKTEDDTDAVAVEQVKAEQKAELAEFDENIPWDEREAERKREEEESKVEMELAMLEKELTPVERYAVNFMEDEMDPLAEELQIAEEDIENAKKEWELGRLKALKEEEERRLEVEEDEMLFTYTREDAFNQVFKSDVDQEKMTMWTPPTPPHDDNDIYIDQSMCFLYEHSTMPETQLPPIYIKKEHKKPKIESITTRKQKQRKEEQPRVPRSLFDRPTSALLKLRREAKLKQGLLKPFRPVPQMINKPPDPTPDHPEWLIHEDWALLQAVQTIFDVPLNLMVVSPAHLPNWDLVADIVNSCSRVYRSAKQCKNRYENVIIPREEGRILYDINPKKQSKKTKGIYKTKNNRPMRTSQLFVQDNQNAISMLYSLRFDGVKGIATKRPPPLKQTLVNPTLKNPKHASVLSENEINYEQPLTPMQVAEIRAQRIQREKKQNQAAAAASAEQQLQKSQAQTTQSTPTAPSQQAGTTAVVVAQSIAGTVAGQQQIYTTVTTAGLTATLAKTAVGQAVTALPRAASNIVVNTPPGVASNFAAINRRMSQANAGQPATVAVSNMLTSAIRAQRPAAPQTIQEITSVSQGATGQIAQITTARTQVSTVTTLTPAQLAVAAAAQQRIPGITTIAGNTVVQQQLTVAAGKTLTPQQQLIQQRHLIGHQAIQQQQQLRMQKLNITQQQLRQIQQSARPGIPQKTVIAQQLVTSVAQVPRMKRQLTQEELNRLKQQQQLIQKSQGQLQLPATQIIAQGQVQQVGQPVSVAGTAAHLVKTVSTPVPLQLPTSTAVSINVTVPAQKTNIATKATISHLQKGQLPPMQLLRKGQPIPGQQKITSITQQMGKTQIPLNTVQIIPQPQSASGRPLTYQLQQIMSTNKPHQGMIITSQPTIIATVTQSQPSGQIVTKVLTSSQGTIPTSQIHTISAASPVISHVTVAASAPTQIPVATISMAHPSQQVAKSVTVATVGNVSGNTVQVHPVATHQARVATLSQASIVAQPVQQIQVTPSGSVQQPATIHVHSTSQPSTGTVASNTSSPLTLTVTPAIQTPPPNVTLIQQQVPVSQTTVQTGTVTSQAALAAAAALPPPSPVAQGIVTTVVQTPQGQQSIKPSPYAMRTRNQPKHQ
ncbi:helicase domino-like isoform X2 [Mytilus californianus]|uniref:helicase domino-like isoform X2 n=1 Tax=Mytilus californianus TaxID=6549 RepID=UPI002245C4C3|nr:helicase domino-like isoform X2 [Mytilus californianus]